MIYTDSTLELAQFLGLPLLAVCSLALLEQRLNGVRWTRKCGRTSYSEEAKLCCRSVSRYAATDADGAIVGRVEEIAKKKDISMAQVALAWILSKDGMSFHFSETTELSMHSSCCGADCGHFFFGEIA